MQLDRWMDGWIVTSGCQVYKKIPTHLKLDEKAQNMKRVVYFISFVGKKVMQLKCLAESFGLHYIE